MRKYPNFPFLAPNSETGGAINFFFTTQLPVVTRNLVLKFHNDPFSRTKVMVSTDTKIPQIAPFGPLILKQVGP